VVDLISGSLVGRVTVNDVMDYIRDKSAETQLAKRPVEGRGRVRAGLNSFRNRWPGWRSTW